MAYGLAVGNVGAPADRAPDATTMAVYGVGLSVLLIPLALISVALISRQQDWPLMVFYGMCLAVGVGLPLLIFRNPLASLIAAYAAAAVITLSRPPGTSWRDRAIAAAIVTVVSIVGMAVAFTLTAVIAPALPFMAVGVADLVTARPTD
jgi:hypothetical protein